MRFDEILYNDSVLDALDDMGFEECTPIQELAIPVIEEGHDLIGVAQTGTGKTAAYLLPVIDILADGGFPEDAINCIVMAPTRELAQQIDQQLQGFAYFMPVNGMAIYGGTDGMGFEQQRQALKKGADIVICTPGRLLAHLSMGYVDLSRVSFFILDEADRMLDMGFYDDIMQIVHKLPKERQTLLFSATMPPKIKQLAKDILTEPKEVKLQVSKPAEKIQQSSYFCYDTQKLPILKDLLLKEDFEKVIVFAGSKIKVKELARAFRELAKGKKGEQNLPWKIGEMHSDLPQEERDRVMLGFKAGKINILVATDIVARGIDIDDISMVVNFDVPYEGEDYVHRIGRTARANNDGKAVTFINEKEYRKFRLIEKFIEKDVPRIPIPEALGPGPSVPEGRGKFGKSKPHNRRHKKAKSKGETNPPAEKAKEGKPQEPGTPQPKKKPRRRKKKPQGEKPQEKQ